MGKQKIIISIVLMIFLSGCFSKTPITEITTNTGELVVKEKPMRIDKEGETLMNNGDYSGAIKMYEEKLKKEDNYENKVYLTDSYLKYGNGYYKESEYSKKALDILNTMEGKYEVLYNKGYAKEIIKDYTGALEEYNKGLEIKDLDNVKLSVLKNQIGHLYDLKGETEKAYGYYEEAYKLYNKNYISAVNLARYYGRKGDYENSKKYFEVGLGSNSKPLRSEINYSLSTIELELNGMKPDINKSIEYAKKSIEENSDYAMGYMALARGYYMLNDVKYDKDIDDNLTKSMELNPNGVEAYKYAALYEYDKNDFNLAMKLLSISSSLTYKDMILMDNQRKLARDNNNYLMLFLINVKTLSEKNLLNSNNLQQLRENLGISEHFNFQLKRINYGFLSKYSKEIDLNLNKNKLGK